MIDTSTAVSVAGVRVLVVDDERAARESMSELLVALGHTVVDAVCDAASAEARARELHPDAVLMDVLMPGASGIEAAQAISRALPGTAIVLISGDDTIRLAVARAGALRQARREAADLKQMLEDRKIIERAKGILMRRTGCSEPEAYRILQRSSQDRSKRMVDIARAVLDSEPGAAQAGTPTA